MFIVPLPVAFKKLTRCKLQVIDIYIKKWSFQCGAMWNTLVDYRQVLQDCPILRLWLLGFR